MLLYKKGHEEIHSWAMCVCSPIHEYLQTEAEYESFPLTPISLEYVGLWCVCLGVFLKGWCKFNVVELETI